MLLNQPLCLRAEDVRAVHAEVVAAEIERAEVRAIVVIEIDGTCPITRGVFDVVLVIRRAALAIRGKGVIEIVSVAKRVADPASNGQQRATSSKEHPPES